MIAVSAMLFAQISPCGSDENLGQSIKNNPELKSKMDAMNEAWREQRKSYNPENYKSKQGLGKASAPKYIIPVVVHVFHGGTANAENISDATVQTMINQLTIRFRNQNSDSIYRRDIFRDLAADSEVEFRLAKKDPQGRCTNGIVRIYNTLSDNGNDDLKRKSAWDTHRYFNIWLVKGINKGYGIGVAGYAQFPAGGGLAATDGIMLLYNYTTNSTATHEAGHWFGLYHPFQMQAANDTCSKENDDINDTPPHFFVPTPSVPLEYKCSDPNYNTCDFIRWGDNPDLPDMQENYMDYFEGYCASNMFTLQQKARMFFVLNNYRQALWSTENLASTGLDILTATPCSPQPAFYSTGTTTCAGNAITFTDNTYNYYGAVPTYAWEFPGGTPATANTKVPGPIVYSNPGSYDVKLTVTNAQGSRDTTVKNYVTILPNSSSTSGASVYYADWHYLNNWQDNGWSFESENGKGKWERVAWIRSTSEGSACMKYDGDPGNWVPSYGFTQSLISPAFNLTSASNPYFEFNYSVALIKGPQSTQTSSDLLRVLYSNDCGRSWQAAMATISGNNISTVGTTQLNYTVGFIPSDFSKWKTVRTPANNLFKNANIRFKIEYTPRGGSSFYLDNVHVGMATSVNEINLASAINFSVQPNPFNNVTKVTYGLNNTEQVEILVFDILGKQVANIFNGKQSSGEHQLEINRNELGLMNGMYFIKMSVGNSNLTHKILVN